MREDRNFLQFRFIPAWAGNTERMIYFSAIYPVHPRVGGGTHSRSHTFVAMLRFIPAWAGNTYRHKLRWRLFTVHPRVGGEHFY